MNALLLACPACSLGSPGFLITSLFIGAPIACFLFLKPYVFKAKKKWGIPRFGLSDFVSLFLLMIWPIFLARSAVEHIPQDRVLVATMLLIFCATFIWYRCLWLLQQNGVMGFGKRTTFTAILLPLMMLLGTAGGYCFLSFLVGLSFGSVDLIVILFVVYLIVAGPLYFAVIAGLKYVFEPTLKSQP